MNQEQPKPPLLPFSASSISWSGILAGVLVILIIKTLLNLLGLSLDFIKIFNTDNYFGFSHFWIISSEIIAMITGGWIAAYYSYSDKAINCILQGLFAWGLALIVSLSLSFFTTENYLRQALISYYNLEPYTAHTLPEINFLSPLDLAKNHFRAMDAIEKQAFKLLNVTTNQEDKAANEKLLISNAIEHYLNPIDKDDAIHAYTTLVVILQKHTKQDIASIKRVIDNWYKTYTDTRLQTIYKSIAIKRTIYLSSTSITNEINSSSLHTFFMYFIGAISASIGGMLCARRFSFPTNSSA